MVHLHIFGEQPTETLTIPLDPDRELTIGRAETCSACIWWDSSISRNHATVLFTDKAVVFRCSTRARNPFIFRGKLTRELTLRNGEQFRIGTTTFRIEASQPSELASGEASSQKYQTFLYAPDELEQVTFADHDKRIELLSTIPDLIADSESDEELARSLSSLLMSAIPSATAVAVAQFDRRQILDDYADGSDFPKPLVMLVQTRDDFNGAFRPSRQLIHQSLTQQRSAIGTWRNQDTQLTQTVGLDWALVSPIIGDRHENWCLYVAGCTLGRMGLLVTEEELAPDLKLTELIAKFILAVKRVRSLEQTQNQLSAFFSPKVIHAIRSDPAGDALQPMERDVTVLCCDIRGFSRTSEESLDGLMPLLDQISRLLDTMASTILEFDGTIADFQGDAALAFWGWPLSTDGSPLLALQAALSIHLQINRDTANDRGERLSVGLGITHGHAIAGQIGTRSQSKVGVFGPVVNQCARLEGMTKQFGVSICIDAPTAKIVEEYLVPDVAQLRRLARVLPKGMSLPMDVFELIAEDDDQSSIVTTMANYATTLSQIEAGNWIEARQFSQKLPDDDGPSRFLKAFLAHSPQDPPNDWSGTIALTEK